MHPPRRNGALERPKLADRLADWLLTHCPITTLTLLTLLVGSTLGIPRPWQVFAMVAGADAMFNVVRLRRRARRPRQSAAMRPGATA